MFLQSCACSIWILLRIIVVVNLVIGIGLAESNDWCKLRCLTGNKTSEEARSVKDTSVKHPSQKGTYVKHTMCLFPTMTLGTRCKKFNENSAKLDECQQEDIVRFHNERRSTVAMGKELRSRNGSRQAPAANMMELIWNDQLAEIAIRWSRQCNYKYEDECRDLENGTVGQNVGAGLDEPLNKLDPLQDFYDEVQDFPVEDVHSYRLYSTGTIVEHYTQIIWAETRAIGCGVADYHHSTFNRILTVVCNYYPSGNIIGDPLYLTGKHCTQCPLGIPCSTKYPALCENPYSPRVLPCSPNTTTTKTTPTTTTTIPTTTTTTTKTTPTTTTTIPTTTTTTTKTTPTTTTTIPTTTTTTTPKTTTTAATTTTKTTQKTTTTTPTRTTKTTPKTTKTTPISLLTTSPKTTKTTPTTPAQTTPITTSPGQSGAVTPLHKDQSTTPTTTTITTITGRRRLESGLIVHKRDRKTHHRSNEVALGPTTNVLVISVLFGCFFL